MSDIFLRSEMLLGSDSMDRLKNSKVIVFGLGGVGSYTAMALARSGVGSMVLVDNDTVSSTNINRQALAFHSTVGRYKTEVMREMLLDINPELDIKVHNTFVLTDNVEELLTDDLDYIVDAIDTVTAKLKIAELADKKEIPLISCMGTGNKLHPELFKIADISETKVCPLCKVIRKEVKERGIRKLKVLYSEEKPLIPKFEPSEEEKGERRSVPGSIAFVPPVAGLMIAGEVIRELACIK
ncbi:MAG: tRNA threonylcarbamoyladenosine dehydratase [Lachnospiraceae bacterium]|nr:tRNA threonylcarbamoyladenosine dehydratase [Lachnospiraceae bacterium]